MGVTNPTPTNDRLDIGCGGHMTKPKPSAPVVANPLLKFERRIVVMAVAEDATHCSFVCPLFSQPGLCSNGILLKYDEPKTNVRGRRYFRTYDCRAEEQNRIEPPKDLDLRVGSEERNDVIRGRE
jgi:hypothetical protein